MKKNLAIETFKAFIKNSDNDIMKDAIITLHPELKESEDERIRRMLIEQITRWKLCAEDNNIEQDIRDASAALAYLEKQKEQKPVGWSEEDENIRQKLIRFISSPNIEEFMLESDEQMFVSWLKSLPPQLKSNVVLSFIEYLDAIRPANTMCVSNAEAYDIEDAFSKQNWEKLVRYINKYQPHWKPTNMQMAVLNEASSSWMNELMGNSDVLKSLYKDLEKL